jgi:hypothetical protein
MFTAKFRDMGAWQVSRCYQREPGKDLNGSITTNAIIKMPASPVAILASLLKPSTAGKGAMIPGIQRAWKIVLIAPGR